MRRVQFQAVLFVTGLLVACGGAQVRVRPDDALERQARAQREAIERLEAQTRAQNDEIERLEGLLALARAEARDLREERVREEGDDAATELSAEPSVPTRRAEEMRPVLRIVGDADEPALSEHERLPRLASAIAPIAAAAGASLGPAVPTPSTGATDPSDAADPIQQRYRQALLSFRARRFVEAREVFTELLAQEPTHAYADDALYWRAEAFYAERQYARALVDFEAVVERFPAGERLADALVKVGLCHRRLGNSVMADRYFERVRSEFPESRAAGSVLEGDPS